MKKTLFLAGSAVIVSAMLVLPAPATGFVTFGCYESQVLGQWEHEVWGGGSWTGPPHSTPFNYTCTETHIFSPD